MDAHFNAVVDAYNQFSFDLLRHLLLQHAGHNLIFSPLNISLTLSLCMNGAYGRTRKEFEQVLHLRGLPLEMINEVNHQLMEMITNFDIIGMNVSLKNKLQVNEDVILKPDFIRLCENQYRTIIETDSDTSQMILHNKLHFIGQWLEGFSEGSTGRGLFKLGKIRRAVVQMMKSEDQLRPYFKTDGVQFIRLPYRKPNTFESGTFGMCIALPEYLDTFLSKLDASQWQTYLSQLTEQKGDLQFPRFRIQNQFPLIPPLNAMGIKSAFRMGQSDLSAMCTVPQNAIISDAQHNTWVEVNEHGTEGVAETAVTFYLYGNRPKPQFQMRVDCPFFFTIEDATSGLILYMGVVRNPNM